MSLPDVLETARDGEPAVAEVALGSEDTLVVTPTRTLVYRAEGLLSDEAVEEYPHDAERISLSEGRRKAKLTLEYGLDGSETLTLPSATVDDAIHPILAGVINAAGVTEPGETVLKTFRFSDLTLIVTSKQVVKHIGSAVWSEEFETFEYDDITDVSFEEGSVATSVVLRYNGRNERFKTPNDEARAVREAIVGAVCEYHDIDSIATLRERADAAADVADNDVDSDSEKLDFGEGLDPLSTDPDEVDPDTTTDAAQAGDADLAASLSNSESTATADSDTVSDSDPTETSTTDEPAATSEPAGTTEEAETSEPAGGASETAAGFEESGFESAGPVDEDDVAEQLAVLVERIDQQEEQLARQNELLETLIEELRRGR